MVVVRGWWWVANKTARRRTKQRARRSRSGPRYVCDSMLPRSRAVVVRFMRNGSRRVPNMKSTLHANFALSYSNSETKFMHAR